MQMFLNFKYFKIIKRLYKYYNYFNVNLKKGERERRENED